MLTSRTGKLRQRASGKSRSPMAEFAPLCWPYSERPLEPFGVVRPDLGVDDTRRPLAVEGIEDLFGGDPAHVFPRLLGDTRGVGACQHVIELQQRMLWRRRFLGPDIEACAGDALFAHRLEQRGLVVDKAPRRGDEKRMRLHQL